MGEFEPSVDVGVLYSLLILRIRTGMQCA